MIFGPDVCFLNVGLKVYLHKRSFSTNDAIAGFAN